MQVDKSPWLIFHGYLLVESATNVSLSDRPQSCLHARVSTRHARSPMPDASRVIVVSTQLMLYASMGSSPDTDLTFRDVYSTT